MILSSADDLRSSARPPTAPPPVTAGSHRPDVVLMDVRMPGVDGITATGRISALPYPPKVIVLTTFHLDEYILGALRAGASGFLLKDTPPPISSGRSGSSPQATPCSHRLSPAR